MSPFLKAVAEVAKTFGTQIFAGKTETPGEFRYKKKIYVKSTPFHLPSPERRVYGWVRRLIVQLFIQRQVPVVDFEQQQFDRR